MLMMICMRVFFRMTRVNIDFIHGQKSVNIHIGVTLQLQKKNVACRLQSCIVMSTAFFESSFHNCWLVLGKFIIAIGFLRLVHLLHGDLGFFGKSRPKWHDPSGFVKKHVICPDGFLKLGLGGVLRMDYDLNQEVTLVLVDSSSVFHMIWRWADVVLGKRWVFVVFGSRKHDD